jgi:hypothetical protein
VKSAPSQQFRSWSSNSIRSTWLALLEIPGGLRSWMETGKGCLRSAGGHAGKGGRATLNIKHDPRGNVVTGIFFASHTSVYTAVYQPLRYLRREKEMIEPHALVGRPPLALVIPECPERPIWVQSPQSICPALSQHSGKGLAAFLLNQRVVI